MISKAQEGTLRGELKTEAHARLSALERGMIKWAVIEPQDKVLDASVGSGMIAEYLKRNLQCEVCGVSDDMENVKQARSRLQSCDIVYASAGDIPWREDSFDTVLIRMDATEPEDVHKRVKEFRRVLKEGGQLVMGVQNALARMLTPAANLEASVFDRHALEGVLSAQEFTGMTYQRIGLLGGVLIAWKRKPNIEAAMAKA